jgi:hypothetical protein
MADLSIFAFFMRFIRMIRSCFFRKAGESQTGSSFQVGFYRRMERHSKYQLEYIYGISSVWQRHCNCRLYGTQRIQETHQRTVVSRSPYRITNHKAGPGFTPLTISGRRQINFEGAHLVLIREPTFERGNPKDSCIFTTDIFRKCSNPCALDS